MLLKVQKTDRLTGSITIPGSKSHSVRGLLLATMAKGVSTLNNVVNSEDTLAAIRVCEALGANVKIISRNELTNGLDLEIQSEGLPLKHEARRINCHNSGITTRFVLPILGLRAQTDEILLEVDEQMSARPIKPLADALNKLGMHCGQSFPLVVSGALTGGKAQIDGTTSQYLSALLMALPCAPNDSQITVNKLNERPYVDMTLSWLRELGIKFTEQNGTFEIPGRQSYKAFQKDIPGDFSSASYFFAAAKMIPGIVQINGLDSNDTQGDKILLSILNKMPQTIDCNPFPDLIPTLAVLATRAKHQTHLINAPQARIKETDRLHSMAEGLKNMGADIAEQKDGLTINPSKLHGAQVHGYGDHRTIMALAIAGLIAEGVTEIDTAEGINKTFPNFVKLMRELGARMQLIHG